MDRKDYGTTAYDDYCYLYDLIDRIPKYLIDEFPELKDIKAECEIKLEECVYGGK